jgi:CRISPR/Cas system CSM-associated protein Csm3 (group 7 of RAMP superfamily)
VVKDVVGRPYIPGSSFKGAYRAHLEALLRAFDPRLACVSVPRPQDGDVPGCLTQKQVDELKDKPELKDDPAKLNRAIIEGCCWACRLCGAPWLASKVLVKDLIVQEESWFGRYVERDGVAIDRDTGTAGNKLKYNFEAVPPGVTLGGGRSRGLGRVTLALDWEQAEVVDQKSLRHYLLTGRGQPLEERRQELLEAFLGKIKEFAGEE